MIAEVKEKHRGTKERWSWRQGSYPRAAGADIVEALTQHLQAQTTDFAEV